MNCEVQSWCSLFRLCTFRIKSVSESGCQRLFRMFIHDSCSVLQPLGHHGYLNPYVYSTYSSFVLAIEAFRYVVLVAAAIKFSLVKPP